MYLRPSGKKLHILGNMMTIAWPEFSFQSGNPHPLRFGPFTDLNTFPLGLTFEVSGLRENVWNTTYIQFIDTNGTCTLQDFEGNTVVGNTYVIYAGSKKFILI